MADTTDNTNGSATLAKADQGSAATTTTPAPAPTPTPGRVAAEILAGYTLADLLELPSGEIADDMWKYIMKDLLDAVGPRDPIERMMAEELVWSHYRLRRLTGLTVREIPLKYLFQLQDQCDKTMNTFRRGMLALKEYRSVRRGTPLVAVQQINEVGRSPSEAATASLAVENVTNELEANGGHNPTDRSE